MALFRCGNGETFEFNDCFMPVNGNGEVCSPTTYSVPDGIDSYKYAICFAYQVAAASQAIKRSEAEFMSIDDFIAEINTAQGKAFSWTVSSTTYTSYIKQTSNTVLDITGQAQCIPVVVLVK